MQDLFAQLEGLRKDVRQEEEKQVEVNAHQQREMTKIKQLIREAEETNQQFKDIQTPV